MPTVLLGSLRERPEIIILMLMTCVIAMLVVPLQQHAGQLLRRGPRRRQNPLNPVGCRVV
ncbi:hypothetical protein ACPWME_02285 [Pandoraea pneumonica]|uniref:hypothetical protein n=1 Tax=Pandoraea pneumonica TaxID=2508299 RepID=UPI003CF80947